MKKLPLLALVLGATLAATSARATTVIPPTFDELVGQAEVIMDATVTEVKSEWTGEGAQRHIVTYVTVKVEEALKGQPGASYTLRMLGGTVGEDRMEVSDAPKFAVGDRDILFVEHNGQQFIPLVGIMHGRFHVEQDKASGARMVKADNGDPVTNLEQLGHTESATSVARKGGAVSADSAPLDVDAFKSAIRGKLADQAQP